LIRIYTFLVYVFMFAPIVGGHRAGVQPQAVRHLPHGRRQLRWFIKLAQNESIIDAFKNSLVLGSLTAVISTGIGILAAWRSSALNSPAKTPSTPCCCHRS
jgi:spermidine/putrescine transport system permease protein